ncbi:fez family zinc finger protein 2-like [Colias croceus]|uniref:fez family zinc finger protein 2-like n=1 Tax=Colias crocea TaxID=72248 RepID=UPI001E27CC33|nr:fez family zinc finger protein 2-like [Colias croceus]
MESYEKLYNSICRLCLKYNKSDNLVPLFDKNSGNVNCYGKAVATFAAIVFKKEDSLPPSMCKKCLLLLKQCIYFKFTCEASDKKLRLLKSLVTENFMQTIVEYSLFKLNNLLNTSDVCNNIPKQTINAKKTKINHLAATVKRNNINNDNQNSLDSVFSLVQIEDLNATPKIEKKTEKPNEIIDSLDKIVLPNKKLCSDKMAVRPKRKLKRRLRNRFIKNTKNKSLDQETYNCNICNKILANQKTYENHMQRHNGCRFICEHCGKGFPVLAELQNHIVARHGTGPCLQCKLCPFKAYKKFDLMEHERIHTGERPFTCEKCGLTFRRRAIWKNHLIYHTEKQIQCTLCPKKFHRRSQMMVHYNSMHDRMYMYVCAKCDAMYAKPVTVRRHMMDKHGVPREMQGKILRVKKSGLQDIS